MADVYITCAPGDIAVARLIRKDLGLKGITAFISSLDHAPDASHGTVPAELKQASCFVVLVNRQALSSVRIVNEMYWANKLNCGIFPLLLDVRVTEHYLFQFYLGRYQGIPAKSHLSGASKKLCAAIDAHLRRLPVKRTDQNEKLKDIRKLNVDICTRLMLVIVFTDVFLISSTLTGSYQPHSTPAKISALVGLAAVISIFLVFVPFFGGYKAVLRSISDFLRNGFRSLIYKKERK